jgi:hypothetical protein
MDSSRSSRSARKRFTREEALLLTLAAVSAIALLLLMSFAVAGRPVALGLVEGAVSTVVCVGSLIAVLAMKLRRSQADGRESGYVILELLEKAPAGLALREIEAALTEVGDVIMQDEESWRSQRLTSLMQTLESCGHVVRSGAVFYRVVEPAEK